MTDPDPPGRRRDLYDPDYARFAWGRYKRLLAWMTLPAALSVAAALAWLRWISGPMPVHMVIATVAGVFFTVMMAAALMGLVFLSSGSGHDETLQDRPRPRPRPRPDRD